MNERERERERSFTKRTLTKIRKRQKNDEMNKTMKIEKLAVHDTSSVDGALAESARAASQLTADCATGRDLVRSTYVSIVPIPTVIRATVIMF